MSSVDDEVQVVADAASGRRRAHSRRAVALTHPASPAGTVIARVLADALVPEGRTVVGLAERAGSGVSLQWRPGDTTSPAVLEALRDVDVLVHVATASDLDAALSEPAPRRRARVLREAQTLTTAAAAAGVRHLVVVTSAMVYGARPDNPVPLPEDAPLRPTTSESLIGDLLAVEDVVRAARRVHPGLQVTTVRPAALVGTGVDTVISRHFEAPRLLVVRGGRPRWQFCHVEDLAEAVLTAVRERLDGDLTVGAPGSLSQEEVEEISGMRHVELAEAAAHGLADRLHRVGLLPGAAAELDYVTHPWVVSSARLLAAGWAPAYDNATALSVLLESVRGKHALGGRRVGSREAAIGAAGAASAAVAIAATATLVRRARRAR